MKTVKGKPQTMRARVAKLERMVEFLRKNSNNMVKHVSTSEGLIMEASVLSVDTAERVLQLGKDVAQLRKNLFDMATVLEKRKIISFRKGGDRPASAPDAAVTSCGSAGR